MEEQKHYNFKKFTNIGGKYEDRVSITKMNFIGLPRVFCARNNIQDFGWVDLYFDEASNAIGIQFLKEQTNTSYKLNYQASNGSASISARAFLKANNIDSKKVGGKYEAIKVKDNEIGDLFVIELQNHEER